MQLRLIPAYFGNIVQIVLEVEQDANIGYQVEQVEHVVEEVELFFDQSEYYVQSV